MFSGKTFVIFCLFSENFSFFLNFQNRTFSFSNKTHTCWTFSSNN